MIRCDLGRDMFKNKLIAQTVFLPQQQHIAEALFCQGNGYLGLRGCMEESYTGERRGLFVSGFYGDSEGLFNFADICNLNFLIDGKPIVVTDPRVSSFLRVLNLGDGELEKSFIYEDNGCKLQFTYSRFVSIKNEHLIATRVKVQVIKGEIDLGVSSGMTANKGNKFNTSVSDGDILQLHYNFNNKTKEAVMATSHRFYINFDRVRPDSRMEENDSGIYISTNFNLKEKDSLTVEKLSNVYTSWDLSYREVKGFNVKHDSLSNIREALGLRYNEHLLISHRLWKNYFANMGLTLKSKYDIDEISASLALYYMRTISHQTDDRQKTGLFGLFSEYGERDFERVSQYLSPYYLLEKQTQARPKNNIYNKYSDLLKNRQHGAKSAADKCILSYRAGNIEEAQSLLNKIVRHSFEDEISYNGLEVPDIIGIWSCFVEGIAGISLEKDILNTAPVGQERISLLQVPVWLNGRQLLVRIEDGKLFIIVSGEGTVKIQVYGEEKELDTGIHSFNLRDIL
ncbi:MAG: hypothetical protein Q4E07_06155 [Eubacteriales bacterium]|nr:hypothetical protein [Eubacteriales bacterium]